MENQIDLFGFGGVEAGTTLYGDLSDAIGQLRRQVEAVGEQVRQIIPGWSRPQQIEIWLQRLEDVRVELRGIQAVPADELRRREAEAMLERRAEDKLPLVASLLRLAILGKLGRLHEEHELIRVKAHAPEFARNVQVRISNLRSVLTWDALRDADRARLPRLTDYVSLAAAHDVLPPEPPAPRVYDEKFGLLVAPALFTGDLEWARRECNARGRSIAIAYADIDDFKSLNREMTESVVDRDVLPTFMRGLEAFVFNRGWAYREGGDEYLLLLPNVTAGEAALLLKDLQIHLASLPYPANVPRAPTISVGFHVLTVESPETSHQAKAIANLAKNEAKEEPKGRVVTATAEHVQRVLEFG